MPWHEGSEGAAVNSIGQRNKAADSQRALWVDVAMAIEGHDDRGHIAILEHPQNEDWLQYSGEESLPPSSGWPGGVITSKKS